MVSCEPRKYIYNTSVTSTEPQKGVTSSPGNSPIRIALPENQKGPGRDWSPDELFVASTKACAMLTFFWLIRNENVEVVSYKTRPRG